MAQLIDLGKLRFHFAGNWSNATEYELNDVVKYGGNVYLYVYTLATIGNLPTNTNFWTLLIEGIKFQGVYSNSANYRIGDGVAHGGKVYICIADTVGNTPPNNAKWSPFVDGIQFEGTWSAQSVYQKNDIVVWGGNAYIASQDSTNQKPSNTNYWSTLLQGISATGVYNPQTNYIPNQLVAYGNTYYRCTAETQGNVPTNESYWAEYLQGLGPQGTWDIAVEYFKNDIVVDGSTVYIYKYATPSTGNAVTNTTYWQVLTSGITTRGAWAPSTQYYSGDVVLRGGNTFITSVFHASGNSFATDLAGNKWTKYNSGIRYRGPWVAATAYLEGDVITDGENARIANKDFTSGQYLADNENDWDILAKGATGLLPAQGGRAGYVLTTDGAEATFERDIVALRFGPDTDAADFETAADLTDTAGVFSQTSSSFVQIALVNQGTGTETSADYIAYSNDGNNDAGFIDMGITGKQFVSEQYGITGPEEGYIFASAAKSDKKVVTNKVVITNLATLTATAHGYSVGNVVNVSIDDAVHDGLRTITAVTANTFSYGVATATQASTPITGATKVVWRPAGTGNLVLATDMTGTQNKIIFAAGGFASGNEQLSITPDENVHIEIATASTSAVTGALTVVGGVGITGDQFIAGDLTVIGNVDLQGVTKLPVGSGAAAFETSANLTNAIIIAAGSSTDYVQNALVNLGTGIGSSADYIAYAKEGDDEAGYIDMGITNAGFNDPEFLLTGAHDGYIFMSAPSGSTGKGNLVIATDLTGTENKIIFAAGGFASDTEQMTITPDENIHIEIATPSVSPTTGALTVVGGVGISGDMNIAGTVNITGTITFGGSGTVVETDNLAVVSPMIFVATGNPTGDGLTFAFLGESRSARTLTLASTVTFRSASNGVATLTTASAHSYELNDSVVITNVDDLAGLSIVIVYEVTGATTAKITTSTNHNLSVGNSISVSGVDAAVNGTYTITAVTAKTITYTVPSTSNVAPAPVSGLVQQVSLPNVYNGTYTITEVPTATTFRYTRAIPDQSPVAPTRVFPNVVSYSVTNGVATIVLNSAPEAAVSSSITVSGVTSQLNGVRTITARSMTSPYSISFTRNIDDIASTTLTSTTTATITSRIRTNSVATITTSAAHSFVPGQSIVVENVSSTFNGTYTITAVTGTTISYAQALADIAETAVNNGTATATNPSFGSYALNGYTGNSVVTNPLRGQYTGLARNQANQKWYLLGGLSNKPDTTIDFSVPGTTYTRNSLNVDLLESRMTIMDKDPWGPLHAMTQQAAMIVPNIITTSQTLVSRSVNTTEGTSVASGLYFVVFSNAMELTLPASPTIGATIVITDISGNAGSFATKPKIMRNGKLIQGKAEDMVFDVNNGSIKLVFSNDTYGWRVTL